MVHYLFPDGKEMAEEYDEKTSELLGKCGPWGEGEFSNSGWRGGGVRLR